MNINTLSSKNHSIETLRAAAVILVFINHLHSLNVVSIPYFGVVGGWIGVQIFFVISGYLIIQSALRYSAGDYIKQRVFRIYPAYLFWFVLFSFVFGQFQSDSVDFKSLLIHLLFLQHFFPEAYLKYNALSVSWTLTIEVVWYVIAFLIATRFVKNPSKITAGFVLVACIWVYGGTKWHPLVDSMEGIYVYFFVHNNAIAQMPFFVFGAWIAVKQPKYDKAALLAIFISTVVLFKSWEPVFPSPIFLTGLGVSALFLILENNDYKNPKSVKILSDISYSFYLIHYPVIVLSSQFVDNKYHQMFLALFATVILSYMSYRLIEQPFMNMAKKKPKTILVAQ
ncbi:acyltransferase [Acidovorax sp. Root267]|uniref:acyltransferase family protein n=1 Tax=Acidovorax sp. Root267 TaxID=1736505 RepID=UPI0009EA25F6|nr:acyltransferase [Acidovorax sp. Root267]